VNQGASSKHFKTHSLGRQFVRGYRGVVAHGSISGVLHDARLGVCFIGR